MPTHVLKRLMPANSVKRDARTTVWTKRGGYADRTLKAVTGKAAIAGLVRVDTLPTSTADGGIVGSDTVYRDAAGNELVINTRYGPTAASNSFTITLTLAE